MVQLAFFANMTKSEACDARISAARNGSLARYEYGSGDGDILPQGGEMGL
jgi:hypothetical protein